jgi:hypothetical protein
MHQPSFFVTRHKRLLLESAKIAAQRASLAILVAQVDAGVIAGAPIELANLQNEIAHGDLERVEPIEMQQTDSEKTQCSNKWRTHRQGNASLVKC